MRLSIQTINIFPNMSQKFDIDKLKNISIIEDLDLLNFILNNNLIDDMFVKLTKQILSLKENKTLSLKDQINIINDIIESNLSHIELTNGLLEIWEKFIDEENIIFKEILFLNRLLDFFKNNIDVYYCITH